MTWTKSPEKNNLKFTAYNKSYTIDESRKRI